MKEKIHTIPVMEAFEAECECAFCYMRNALETSSIDFMLGASAPYMEEHIRMVTDEVGFCAKHYQALFAYQNTLGLALILNTHLKRVNKQLEEQLQKNNRVEKQGFFLKTTKKPLQVVQFLQSLQQKCYICDMVEKNFSEYVDTFFYLWKTEKDMKLLVEKGKGFCLPHFTLLLELFETKLHAKEQASFFDIITKVQMQNLNRVWEDVDWFTKKFDYRFQKEPWKESKDAVPRCITKLSSAMLTTENKF